MIEPTEGYRAEIVAEREDWPYNSVHDALVDGWQIIQFPNIQARSLSPITTFGMALPPIALPSSGRWSNFSLREPVRTLLPPGVMIPVPSTTRPTGITVCGLLTFKIS